MNMGLHSLQIQLKLLQIIDNHCNVLGGKRLLNCRLSHTFRYGERWDN